jgi:iron complex transport system substrate-binding protein
VLLYAPRVSRGAFFIAEIKTMKFKSNPSTLHEISAHFRNCRAAIFYTRPMREIGSVAQALLPVRVLSAPAKTRTGKSWPAEKDTPHFCLFLFLGLNRSEIPRLARNDKKNYSSLSLKIVGAACVVFLILCADPRAAQTRGEQIAPPSSTRATFTVTDEVGRRVQIPREMDRVVSLAPNLTEIVFALGDGNRLAGDSDFCDYPAEALQKPHVGGPVNPNLEEIVSLMPDLVLATKSINRRETVNALDRIGLPVYVTDPHSVQGMIASVEHLGSALGAEKSAATLADDLRERLSDLDHRLAGAAPRRVLFVVWTDPLISVGRGTFIADALRRAGGRSVVETTAEWPHVSLEEIVRLQPEVLVFASAHAGDTQRDIGQLRTRPGWRNLEAMRNGNIVVVSDAINRPAPRMVDAIERLARALHPEAFMSRDAPSADSNSDIEEACACAR